MVTCFTECVCMKPSCRLSLSFAQTAGFPVVWLLFSVFFILSPCDVLTLVFPYCPFLSASMATAKDFPGTTTGKYFFAAVLTSSSRDRKRRLGLTSSIACAGSHCLAWEHCWSLWNVMVLHGAVIHPWAAWKCLAVSERNEWAGDR